MGIRVRVTKISEIPAAVELAEQFAASFPGDPGTPACPLICEELLLRLLNTGCPEISVSIKGLLFKHIEIRARGKRADEIPAKPEAEKNDTGRQINDCLLEQYTDHYNYRYVNGINLYSIYGGKSNTFDLTEEIYGYYRNADPAAPHQPTDVLRYIARRHQGFFALSVFIHLLKHLGALMLPVFVSNIINIVTETGAFFTGPVYLNILMALVSLSVNLICYWLDSRYYRRFTRAVEAGFRMALVQKLQVLSMRFHSGTQSGVVLSKLVSDVQFIQMLIYDRFMEVLYLSEDVVFIIVVALMKFPLMLAFYAAIIPAVIFLLRRFTGPMQDRRAGMRKQNEQVSAAVKEMLEMEGLNRAHGLAKTEYRSILAKVRSAQRAAVLYDRQTVSVNNITYGVFQGLRLLSLSFAALLTATGHIEVGTLVLFQSIFEMIISNVQRMLDSVPMITQGYDSLKSVNEILYAGDLEKNGSALLPAPVQGASIPPAAIAFGIIVLLGLIAVALAIAIIIDAFLINPLAVGAYRFSVCNLNQKAQAKEAAYAFDSGNYLEIAKTMILRDIFIALWCLLLIIPGIVKAYEYRMIPYLLADDPTMTKDRAFAESRAMMRGNKWRAFVLDLSFLGWHILSVFTLGILELFYVAPYEFMADAALYESLRYGTPAAEQVAYSNAAQIPVPPFAEDAGFAPESPTA